MFVGLLKNGEFVKICADTLIQFYVNTENQLYKDFIIIPDNNCNHNLLVITQENEIGFSFIQLLNFADFSIIFSLKLTNPVCLVSLENTSDDILYIVEIAQNNKISELRFTVVNETVPEKRLKKLLKKQDFDEAEKFASLFGLDMTIIKKAKAQLIVDKMVCDEEDIKMLLTMLDSIDDFLFSLHCCHDVHFSCERLEDVKKVLLYGCRELPNHLVSNTEVYVSYEALCNLKFRFEIFMALVWNSDTTYEMQDWSYFSTCDLIDEIIVRLRNYNIEESIIIYSRLDNSTFNVFLVENVKNILEVLNNLPPHECEPFLHVYIPVTLSHLPSTLPLFVSWLCNRIILIEQKYALHFPENAIKFTNMVVKLLQVQSDVLDTNIINELTNLSTALKHLQVLKNNFKIVVPLEEYLKGPKSFIRTLLNISMDEDEYEIFLQNFLNKYILENHFSPNEIFLNEIQDIIKYEEKYWIQVVPHMLKCINSVETKLQAILILISAAGVPWSDTFRSVCEKALEYSHPLVEIIRKKIENHPVLVVLRKPKYNIKGELHSLRDLKFFINRIIKVNEPTMLEDIYQICKDEVQKHEANLILALHFIKLGDFSKVCFVLDNNTEMEIFECCKYLTHFLKLSIENKYNLPHLQHNCYQVAHSIFNRLQKCILDLKLSHKFCSIVDLKTLNSIYKINHQFGKKITTADIQNKTKRNELLDYLIYDIIEQFLDGRIEIVECINMCNIIADLLFMNRNEVIIYFCSKLENFNAILHSSELIYKMSNNSKHLCLIAVLILKYVGSSMNNHQTIPNLDETFMPQNINLEVNVFIQGLRLAEKIAAKAILNAEVSELDACVEVLKWVQTTYFMVLPKNDTLQAELLMHSIVYDFAVPANNTFESVKSTFNLYVDYIKGLGNPNTRYLTYFNSSTPPLTEGEFMQEIKHLPHTVQNMCTQGQTLSAYKLIVTLESSLAYASHLNNRNIHEALTDVRLKMCTTQLLQQVISARHVDSDLAYDLLLAYSSESALNFLSKAISMHKKNVARVQTIAQISLRVLSFHMKGGKDKIHLQNIILTCKWWKKVNTKNLNCNDFFKMSPEQLLKKLILFNHLDVTLLQEFCQDFNLEVQKCYLIFLKITLSNWKPDFTVTTCVGKKGYVTVKSNEIQIFETCKPIVDNITNKELLFDLISSLWNQINFYYYEVFICLLKLSPQKNITENYKKQLLLLFLKEYTRVSKPSQAEIEQWYTLFPDTQDLDPLSEFRLPFTQTLLTNNIWSIIRPEVTLKTYTYWFDAIDILKGVLTKDDICSFVIKEVVSSGLLQKDNTNSEWIMYPVHEALFQEIDICVQNITDLERATSVVYHLMTHTPRGADQVNAAKLCYKYALKYYEQSADAPDVEKAFVKVHKKYLSYSAIQILYLNQLAEEKYLKLVSQPHELIESLYMDERIIKLSSSVVLHFPDINKTVDELATLYEIDITQKRMSLLDSWLSNATVVHLNASLNSVLTCDSDISLDTGGHNLKRASYLCTSSDPMFWKTHLLNVGLSDSIADSKGYSHKAKTLLCFCKITEEEDIEAMTNSTKEELKTYIQKLFLIHDLQYLGYNFNVESLDTSNKRDILRRLVQNQTYPSNVKLMASICMTYNIYNLKYWEHIMNAANQLNMLKELQEYLQFLKSETHFTNKNFYILSWQKVIEHLFIASINGNNDSVETFVENIRMIQTSPVLYSLDFRNVIDNLLKLNRPEVAAVLLQYVPESKRLTYIKEILQLDQNISQSVDNLAKYGIWCIRTIKRYFELMESSPK